MSLSVKNAIKFTLVILPVAAVAGVFTGISQFDAYDLSTRQLILEQLGSRSVFIAVGAVQTVVYAAVCGFFGFIVADKVGLVRPFRLERDKVVRTIVLSLVCGVVFSLDYWTFGAVLPQVQSAEVAGLTAPAFVSAVLYGGVVEELMLRLFLMSLLVLAGWKLFFRGVPREDIPAGVFAGANVLSAMLFAAGHLPATVVLFGGLTPLVLLRCFLLNGGFGLVFGWLYRRYGIQYAMIAHAGVHVVSRLVWLIFV